MIKIAMLIVGALSSLEAFYYPFTRMKSLTWTTILFETKDNRDWRAFRAKLVLEEKEELGRVPGTMFDQQNHFNDAVAANGIGQQPLKWIHEVPEVERGSILIHTPRPQDIYGLGRQCLYQSVVLVIETNPEETIGILLNRPTDMTIETLGFEINYGGEDYSIHAACPRFYVMNEIDVGIPIISGISLTTMEVAKNMMDKGNADPRDFSVYCGHVSWPVEQLRCEVSRGIWKCLSVDAKTIHSARHDDGDCRMKLLPYVSASLTVPCQFDERMLQEWSRLHLSGSGRRNEEAQPLKKRVEIKAGDLLRSSAADHAFLFADQEFHKSLLLVIQEDEDFSVAVLLNHPTNERESSTGLPVRYGGNYGELGDGSAMPPFCLHHLGGVVGGEPVGNHLYKASIDHAIAAIQEGSANPNDFLVVQGISVWPKDEFSSGICDNGCFEVVEPESIPQIWKLLSSQNILSPLAMESNIDIGMQAWQIASNEKIDSRSDLLDLGMLAVKTWLAAYLLEDPDCRP